MIDATAAHLGEGARWRVERAIGALSPAGDGAISAQPTVVQAACADLGEGARRGGDLAKVVLSPAQDAPVGLDATGVIPNYLKRRYNVRRASTHEEVWRWQDP